MEKNKPNIAISAKNDVTLIWQWSEHSTH